MSSARLRAETRRTSEWKRRCTSRAGSRCRTLNRIVYAQSELHTFRRVSQLHCRQVPSISRLPRETEPRPSNTIAPPRQSRRFRAQPKVNDANAVEEVDGDTEDEYDTGLEYIAAALTGSEAAASTTNAARRPSSPTESGAAACTHRAQLYDERWKTFRHVSAVSISVEDGGTC
ncbi:uncharacterized protein PG986_014407 [Apiospora aurea]|uniref:Uncharacterized protein n=1 Tax=Apiospora aurea TaxID=335848 RepID=A0ABR1PTW5_9PEZI